MSADEKATLTLERWLAEAEKSATPKRPYDKDSSTREFNVAAKQREFDEANSKRTGRGTRLQVGQTRGKNPQIVVWEAFDESKPDTMPDTVDSFYKLTGVLESGTPAQQEATLVSWLVDGYNAAQYTAASDPIAEHINPAWDLDMQKQFKIAIRNYTLTMQSVNPNYTLDEAVTLLKPSIEAGFAAQKKG
jgi:hypothetical protein